MLINRGFLPKRKNFKNISKKEDRKSNIDPFYLEVKSLNLSKFAARYFVFDRYSILHITS